MSESGNAAPSDPSAPVDGHEELQVCPPGGAFVTLSEALSWIAFRVSVGCDALSVRLGEDTHAATDGHRLLRTALDALLNDGRSGRIPLVGKYIASSNVHIATVLPDTIDPTRLLAFARFNIFRDGLEFGTGLTWHHYDGQMMLARPQNVRRDYFHSVQVARAELMDHFPPQSEPIPDSVALPTGDPGRPPKGYHLYIAEHDRRCLAGEALDKVAHEAAYLAKWYAAQYPTADPVSPGTVENRIRIRHRKFVSAQAHDITVVG